MTIPFNVKLLTKTAKAPTQENPGDLWDLYADDFDFYNEKAINLLAYVKANLISDSDQKYTFNYGPDNQNTKVIDKPSVLLMPGGRILVKTGIAIQLPNLYETSGWSHQGPHMDDLLAYGVADIRPRSGLALKQGITVLNTPGTIDNSYRKEIGIILYNAGQESYVVTKGDKIAQMLIRPLYTSSLTVVEDFTDMGRGGFGSTGK